MSMQCPQNFVRLSMAGSLNEGYNLLIESKLDLDLG